MKVAIIGSRSVNESFFEDLCACVPQGTSLIISGGAKGADTLAEKYALENNIKTEIIRPDYAKFGKHATVIRNEKIVKKADYVIAIWDGISKGTGATINICIKEYIPIKVIYCGEKTGLGQLL